MIIELVVTGFRVLGKATAAAGSQAVKSGSTLFVRCKAELIKGLTRPDFKHKPDGAPSSGAVGTGSSKSQITNQMQMSLDEAHLILNVKKDDPLEVIEKVSHHSHPHLVLQAAWSRCHPSKYVQEPADMNV